MQEGVSWVSINWRVTPQIYRKIKKKFFFFSFKRMRSEGERKRRRERKRKRRERGKPLINTP